MASSSSQPADTLTPLMRQYRRMKSEIDSDVLLMFRLGDFYEMFFEDAQEAAPILGVVLTKRCGYPMCGIPYHAIDAYLGKLIRANRKIAICDQMEDPALAKGLVRREITRIVTPGTVTEEGSLSDDQTAYLVAIHQAGPAYGVAWLELSTGTFFATEETAAEVLCDRIRCVAPRECLLGDEADPALEILAADAGLACVTRTDSWRFEYDVAREELCRHFGVASLEGYGVEGKAAVVGAAGALLQHVRDRLHRPVDHIRGFRLAVPEGHLMLDEVTCAHLDLLPVRGRDRSATLFGVLDVTKTPMGARRLHDWILRPLADVVAINGRLVAVSWFLRDRRALSDVRAALGGVRDLERLVAKLALGRAAPRDLLVIVSSLATIPALRKSLGDGAPSPGGRNGAPDSDAAPVLSEVLSGLVPLPDLVDEVRRTIVDDPPATLADGGVVREGYSEELDSLRAMANDGRAWIARYQAKEAERTGIRTLKVRHTNVFGYFIEIPSSQSDKVPPEYRRKQALVNAERYITDELKEYEEKIATAHERGIALEEEIFQKLRALLGSRTDAIQRAAGAMADLDVLASFADRALALGYGRPTVVEEPVLEIKEGRHPIVEQLPDAERFVPNDTLLDGGENRLAVITGPNMAGKSTYIRQVAMMVVMAQMGCFVPAREATIGIADRVFTRVGASDDLARGRSTFMVEMQETANILNNATRRSLIVLDEIGRGTSTFDGISIAWAVAEHLHEVVGARTLFATHYHELTDLAQTLPGVKNYCVLVKEQRGGIAFLRRIVPGAADKSYGIAVAQLAGLPGGVVSRAKDILENLEESEHSAGGGGSALARPRHHRGTLTPDNRQMLLF